MYYTIFFYVAVMIVYYVYVACSGVTELTGSQFKFDDNKSLNNTLNYMTNIMCLICWDGWMVTLVGSWANLLKEKEEAMRGQVENRSQEY